ncbi:hypothetical protein UlMin_013110 [Ulmus minor]
MDSKRRLSLFASLLLLISLLFAICSSSSISNSHKSDRVSLELYYETLCPFCADLIVNDLAKLFKSDVISIVDLKLVPYGNARVKSNNSITCQHGPEECFLNTVEACAINIWPQLNVHFPFVHCVETLANEFKYNEWESCLEKLNLDSIPITDCYTGKYGKKLELQYAAETKALKPPHQYVPWTVLNGQKIDIMDYEDLVSNICKAYKGTNRPESCRKKSVDSIGRKGADKVVYFIEKAERPALQERVQSAISSWMNQKKMAALE